ncbi:MAG: exonuclease SbcCD subunit D, partial [Planctomycetaceae bacterium]
MAYRSQRFIQAANLRLDVPVSVSLAELPDDSMRVSLEDATLLAFDAVIDNCILHDVDFLLLSGNVFIEADRSLRARLSIQRCFQRLHEAGIHVFVLPGDSDPAEAWRLVPDLPDNVTICYSSNPEPESLLDGESDVPMTLVSSALWIGAADDFGIQVIARGGQSLQPFRIGVLSRARYEESQRMAALAASTTDDVLLDLAVNPSSGEKVAEVQSVSESDTAHITVWRSVEAEQGERPAKLPQQSMRRLQDRSGDGSGAAGGMEHGFLAFADEVLREGQLNFLALLGEAERVTLWR